MRFHVLTLFPEMIQNGLGTSILGRASKKGLIGIHVVNIRDYTKDRHNKVDDYPYGGGAGMLMQAQPIYDAFCAVRDEKERKTPLRVIYLTPQGAPFHQKMARELAGEEELVFLCGHYEGVDERVLEEIVTDPVSIGDYVLTGGELAAMVMIDAISRMVPGVLSNEESGQYESFYENLLEYPQYTRPEVWRGRRVPDVLLSGDHQKVERWRLAQSVARTKQRRPDLYAGYDLSGRALSYLEQDRLSQIDMIECIRRGQADVLHVSSWGVLLREKNTGIYLISAADQDGAERLLSLTRPEGAVYCCHQEFIPQSIARRFGKENVGACYQAVYTKKTPFPESQQVRIRPLSPDDLETVYAHYHTLASQKELSAALQEGRMFGAYLPAAEEEEILSGFIGTHAEGSMGMLEVFEGFRRRGIARALVCYLTNRTLEAGQTPYGQIYTDNEPSLNLQKKLGFRISQKKLYWVF